MLREKPRLTILEFSDGTTDLEVASLSKLVELCPAIQEFGMRFAWIQRVLEKGKFINTFVENLTAVTDELVKFSRLETLTFLFRTPNRYPELYDAGEYGKDADRYRMVADKIYSYYIQAANKAGKPCVIKTIQLKSQSFQDKRTEASLRIKPHTLHVFNY
jgi:hypothetical protein